LSCLPRCQRESADAVVAGAQKVGLGVALGCEGSQWGKGGSSYTLVYCSFPPQLGPKHADMGQQGCKGLDLKLPPRVAFRTDNSLGDMIHEEGNQPKASVRGGALPGSPSQKMVAVSAAWNHPPRQSPFPMVSRPRYQKADVGWRKTRRQVGGSGSEYGCCR
jgi:hypothetical protein